ncbi:MAG: hypothetical protein R3C42_05105 [Parvularculaceae bacterium]|nr:hypothetical protein [Parvularculaceae bacterium]
MRKWIARRLIDRFGARYDYDVGYMRHLLEVSPSAFFKFISAAKLSSHGEAAPKGALAAARIVGAMTEDCGPCVQIFVDMAREAGIDDNEIDAVLRRDVSAMNRETAIGYIFADRLARRENADAVREEARAEWGDKAVIDLTFALQGARLYPMTKAGLGFASECARVKVGDNLVAVVKAA